LTGDKAAASALYQKSDSTVPPFISTHAMKNIVIIESPSNLGLKRPAPGREPGVRKLPEHLRRLGLHKLLGAERVYRLEAPDYDGEIDSISGVRNG
jgi:arginase